MALPISNISILTGIARIVELRAEGKLQRSLEFRQGTFAVGNVETCPKNEAIG